MCGSTGRKGDGTAHTCSVGHWHPRRENEWESPSVLRFLFPPSPLSTPLVDGTRDCHLEDWRGAPLLCTHSAAAALGSLGQATTTCHREVSSYTSQRDTTGRLPSIWGEFQALEGTHAPSAGWCPVSWPSPPDQWPGCWTEVMPWRCQGFWTALLTHPSAGLAAAERGHPAVFWCGVAAPAQPLACGSHGLPETPEKEFCKIWCQKAPPSPPPLSTEWECWFLSPPPFETLTLPVMGVKEAAMFFKNAGTPSPHLTPLWTSTHACYTHPQTAPPHTHTRTDSAISSHCLLTLSGHNVRRDPTLKWAREIEG